MRRVLRLSRGYILGRARLSITGAAARSLAATLRSLEAADVLPGPVDFETLIPPVRRAWVRRVIGANLWVIYAAREGEVHVLAIMNMPPVPID